MTQWNEDRTVQAYTLMNHGTDVATIVMPADAQIIDLGPYNGQPAVWAIVKVNSPTTLRRFQMVPTGFIIPREGTYIGSMTLFQGDRATAMHFFEIPVPPQPRSEHTYHERPAVR